MHGLIDIPASCGICGVAVQIEVDEEFMDMFPECRSLINRVACNDCWEKLSEKYKQQTKR